MAIKNVLIWSLCWSLLALVELDSMLLMGPFQLGVFCNSVNYFNASKSRGNHKCLPSTLKSLASPLCLFTTTCSTADLISASAVWLLHVEKGMCGISIAGAQITNNPCVRQASLLIPFCKKKNRRMVAVIENISWGGFLSFHDGEW